MTEPRKASEILLDLEVEIRKLKETINLQDHLLKLVLNNSNKTNAMLNALIDVQHLTDEQRDLLKEKLNTKSKHDTIAVPSGFPIETEKDFKGQRRVTRVADAPSTKASNADIEFKDYIMQKKITSELQNSKLKDSEVKNQQQNARTEKKIPVVQRVQDNNKKDLFMAEVNIISDDGQFTAKTKTNAMGKWQAQLPPGNYNIKVSKMDTVLKKKLEAQQNINIPNSNSPITLAALIINRE